MNCARPLSGLVLAAVMLGSQAPALAQNIDQAVILVAKPALRDRLYRSTVLIVTPLGKNEHIGFIVNKPTRMTLGKLFPNHEPSQKVVDPVYLGGPVNTGTIFALVQRESGAGGKTLQFTPDLQLVVDGEQVDQVIETESDHARFFAGLVLWTPGELRTEIEKGFWYVLDPDTSLVLRKPTSGMWQELVKRLQKDEPKGIRTRLETRDRLAASL
jgi:putative transcriptional regulator